MRTSGILLHVSALPSPYGIGTFGKEAYKFVDKLKKANQTYWQILPLGPTSYGDSPYQTFSAFALNPYFIDLDMLISDGLLSKKDIIDSETENFRVDFEKLYHERFVVLRKAFQNFDQTHPDYLNFIQNEKYWLEDYALFMSIKSEQNGRSWIEWPEELRLRNENVINNFKEILNTEIEFQYFIQYKAYEQWNKLKKYANHHGIKIIGDMPIYVALDSSDVWTKPHIFQLDERRIPTHVAGVPPDNYSVDGQLWGNPLYRWDVLEENHFDWWIDRVKSNVKLFDMIRIDHFIGFVNYFSIPYTDTTARNGEWKKGPGRKLFDEIKRQLGDLPIIAEDLGAVTDEVRELLRYTNFPGMKLLQFAFDSREESDYIPHLYSKNIVAYTGTHDNPTTKEWFKTLNKSDYKYCLNYINHQKGSKVDSLIKETLKSIADTAIIPMQDYLNLGAEGRFNLPSTLGNHNWTWRMKKDQFNTKILNKIKSFTHLYGRDNK